jgi:hypothetical protein
VKLSAILELIVTGKKLDFEWFIKEEILKINALIDFLIEHPSGEELFQCADEIETLILDFQDLIGELNCKCEENNRKPFYWTYLYSFCFNLRILFNHYYLYANQLMIHKTTISAAPVLKSQKLILENVGNFVLEYINNRKYVSELLKNNLNEINNLSRLLMLIIEKTPRTKDNSPLMFEILRSLREANYVNEKNHVAMNEIFIQSHI